MIAVVTLTTRERLAHLERQREALQRWAPHARHLLVVMDDADIDHPWVVRVSESGRLPLALARNRGAAEAIERGADVLAFLDVDCIPGPDMVGRYADAVVRHDALTCGMVTYLPPAPPGGYRLDALTADPHPARPAMAGKAQAYASDDEYRLFWSLSFALSPGRWRQIGGFCEDYRGYGGEDTDFGFRARAAGVPMLWLGGADAYHQHHPVTDPPWQHLGDIVRNARLFHSRWGVWPMDGWLRAFADAGAIRWTDDEIVLLPAR